MLACDSISEPDIDSIGMVKRFKKKSEVRIMCRNPVTGLSCIRFLYFCRQIFDAGKKKGGVLC